MVIVSPVTSVHDFDESDANPVVAGWRWRESNRVHCDGVTNVVKFLFDSGCRAEYQPITRRRREALLIGRTTTEGEPREKPATKALEVGVPGIVVSNLRPCLLDYSPATITVLEQTGRPIIYGLAAKGEYGVSRVIKMLKDKLELTMALSGCPILKDITRSLVRTVQTDSTVDSG